ncbi:MAG: neutral/alkaline non-lysosomal ceramidase N-terminal domain-containing protein [Planctomycetes bacterium]|nr:neutral/alkaline non-lysosomal ceramidase N-terminal domain-containing protein [Planctomycetota bacterium]
MKAGCARVDITPPIGVDMTGFAARPGPSRGVRDPLHARALVLEEGSERIGIVTMDLLSLDFGIVDWIRREVQRRTGMAGDHLLLSASHTHSGPATISLRGLGSLDSHYLDVLRRQVAGVVQMAAERLEPAELGFGNGQLRLGLNRRHPRKPQAPRSDGVDVLRVDRAGTGHPLAILFSCAVHPVILGPSNLQLSRDYPGAAVDAIERAFPGALGLFAQGCCGDINPEVGIGNDFGVSDRAGNSLGAEAARVAASIQVQPSATLRAASRTVLLPQFDPPPLAEARETLKQKESVDEKTRSESKNRGYLLFYAGLVEWARAVCELSQAGLTGFSQPIEIQCLRMGDGLISALSGEMLVRYDLRWRGLSPFPYNFILAYSNGCLGYVPPAEEYPFGGYEVDMAYQFYGTLMVRPESEELIFNALTDLARSLSAS